MPTAVERPDALAPTAPTERRVPPVPVLPAEPAATPAGRDLLRTLRLFARSGHDPSGTLRTPVADDRPALLHALRDPERVRTGEPILLVAGAEGADATSFGDWLEAAIADAFPEADAARVLRDNALRLERAVRMAAQADDRPATARELLLGAVDAAIAEIGLHGEAAGALRSDGAALANRLDRDDAFVTLDDDVPLATMIHLARHRHRAAREAFRARATALRDRLARMLEAQSDRAGAAAADRLADALSVPGAAFDRAALAKIVRAPRGPVGLPEARRRHVAQLRETLDAFLAAPDGPAVVVVAEEGGAIASTLGGDVEVRRAALPGAEAARAYDARADALVPVCLAVRLAELEVEDRHDPAVHAAFVASFDRDALRAEETAVLPAVVALESIDRLCGPDMPNVVRTLLAGRPVRVLLEVAPGAHLGTGDVHEAAVGARFEPGLFGIGLRSAIVHQSSVAAPGHLARGFRRALGSTAPSLHVVATGVTADGGTPVLGRWLHAAAAADARAHPLFLYDPTPGPTWADRFDFAGNEQPEADWPEQTLACLDAVGVEREHALDFTFADFAALEPAWRHRLRFVPEECPTNDLATVAECLAVRAEPDRRVPFVWIVSPDGRMRRAVVARTLLEACRDRHATWATLQQAAGIHDVYAERAAESARRTAGADADARVAALERAHAEEIERIRREEAGIALGRLAESILGVDPDALAAAAAPRAPAKPAKVAKAAKTAAPAPEATVEAVTAPAEPEDDGGFDEPYIDSALCTSCNDCVNINSRLFVYNRNKQATIGDPDAGTFAELVMAAEKCPARCIHPGKPRNPDEPNLPELTERAKRFN